MIGILGSEPIRKVPGELKLHNIAIRQEIVDRVLVRRKSFHLFDSLDPSRTCCVIIDIKNLFCEPGGAAEVPAVV